jgi:5'-nucleotidase
VNESEFEYIAGNVMSGDGSPFPGVKPYRILTVTNADGQPFRVGVLGVTADIVPVDYVDYLDHKETIHSQLALLRDSVDAFVGITHLFLAQDIELANEASELSLIMGGHDHENLLMLRGPAMTPIAKADANARSVVVHTLRHDFETGRNDVQSRILPVTDAIPDQPLTESVVQTWLNRAWEGFRDSGFAPEEVVAVADEPLDGRESFVRTGSTVLTKVIADGIRAAADEVDLVMYNAGGIRIDDVIPPGPVTQYDVIRILPFGGDILTVEMSGSVLDSVLTQGLNNKGGGGYLQTEGVRVEGGVWFTNDGAVLPNRVYSVALNDFLVSGRESGLAFLTLEHTHVTEVARHGDIRFAVIEELRRRYARP